jgi:LPXTG-site transpeptidase (sortase) family protein
MPAKLARLFVASVVAVALTLGSALAAAAYIEQSQIQVLLSGPSGTVRCDRSASISAKVVSTKTGKPVSNQLVRWSLSGAQSGSDGLSASSTVTNKQGQTGVSLTFGPVAGARTVTASASRVSPSVTVRCAGGLPRTATLPPVDFVEQPSSVLLAPPSVPEPGLGQPTPATDLRLDRLGIDVSLVEGDGVTVPDDAAAHYPGTAWPGEGSNTYLYGHAREGDFLELWGVRTGDVIELDMADGSTVGYTVTEIRPVVRWDALEYLAPTASERLTLQTCLSYDETSPRFIVIAEPLSGV